MTKYLVTGGAGFIGSNIVEKLLTGDQACLQWRPGTERRVASGELEQSVGTSNRGKYVRVLDNFSTGRRQNITEFVGNENFELVEGDLRSYHIVQKAVKDIDYVLHQGALPSVPRSVNDPITTNDVNVNGTLNILDASINAGVKRVVYASSSSIYGDGEELPKREDMKPAPESPYAMSKYAGERYCQIFTKIYGLETVCLRYFNVFGPRQDPTSQYSAVIPKFINLMLNGKSPTIYGDGLQSRDFTYVANVVQANLLACETDSVTGEVFNAACGNRHTVLDLVAELNKVLDTDIEPVFAEPRKGDVKHSMADISKAKKFLKYRPGTNFSEGLDRTVKCFNLR